MNGTELQKDKNVRSRLRAPIHCTGVGVPKMMNAKEGQRPKYFVELRKCYSVPFVEEGYFVLDKMVFCTREVGWAVGPQQVIRTTDGGRSWANKYNGELQNLQVVPLSIAPLNSLTCWIVGSSSAPGLVLFKTTNGGDTWQKVSVAAANCAEDLYPKCVSFIDFDTGWVLASSSSTENIETHLFNTSDGGLSWQRQSLLPTNNGMPSLLHFTKSGYGYVAEHRDILKPGPEWSSLHSTKNGGQRWDCLARFDGSISALLLHDLSRIYIGDEDGSVLMSEDAGSRWRRVAQLDAAVHAIAFDRSGAGFIAGDSDTALISQNNGTTWAKYSFAGLVSAVIDAHFPTNNEVTIASTMGVYRVTF